MRRSFGYSAACIQDPRCPRYGCPRCHAWQSGYVLLETVIATGLLVIGLAVIGAQVQDADTSLKQMERRTRAMMLAESQFAQMDLGLVKLDSIDPVQEGDFGPRYPDYGWMLITQQTAIEGMYALTLEVWHKLREDRYTPDSFDFRRAERIHTVCALRAAPQSLDLGVDFGVPEQELGEVTKKLSLLGIPGLDAASFDPTILATLDFDQFLEVFPILVDVMGISIQDLKSLVPPDILTQLQESGGFDTGSGGDTSKTPGPGGGKTGGDSKP